ncbi:MAG: SDR family oxidoreductase [Patescibacteria group bacterium]
MKNAIVTGASTGIGRATSIKMAEDGFHIFLIARSKDKLEETADLINEIGSKSTVLVTDLSNLDSINNLIGGILEKVDSVDAIVNIAGIWHGKDKVFADTAYQSFNQKTILDTHAVGFTAPSLLVHGLLPKMKSGSKIVNLSGTFQNGAKGWLPYFASKRALEDLTIGLSQELEDKNIQVNCVSPSDTATEEYEKYFPQYIDEAISPEKIADKIVELCQKDNKTTGKVFVMENGKEPFEGFHY